MGDKLYSVLTVDLETLEVSQQELKESEAFDLVSSGLAQFVNPDDFKEYVAWVFASDS